MMDGLRLQDYTIAVADGTAWLTNERIFKNSCVQSLQQFKQNFVHIDNWCGNSPCNNDDTLLNGVTGYARVPSRVGIWEWARRGTCEG